MNIKSEPWEFPGGPVLELAPSLPRAQAQTLFGELRSHKPRCAAKKKKRKKLNVDYGL